MRITLALTDEIWLALLASLDIQVETAAVLLVREVHSGNETTLLARRILWVPDDAYETRERQRLVIRSMGWVPSLKEAAEDDCLAMFFHSHPGSRARPSAPDELVNEQLREPFSLRTSRQYASLILGGTRDEPYFTGTLGDSKTSIGKVRVVGPRLRIYHAEDTSNSEKSAQTFDRQIRAFGRTGQDLLASLRVGVAGAGGTGSAVCEQLIRLGVGELLIVDDDVVSETNLTRIHESGQSDVGHPKATVVHDAAERIGLYSNVSPVIGRVTHADNAQLLRHCDVIFGCTDDNGGRAVISRLAYWYLIPVIDCGFVVDVVDQHIRGLFGRVSTVFPGAACLICRGAFDPALAAAEALPVNERARLAGEGYVPGLGEPDPSVVTYTTLVGSFAVNELLTRLFGYGGEHPPTELLVRLHDRYLSNRSPAPRPDHYCVDRAVWGRGDQEPFLDQLWP